MGDEPVDSRQSCDFDLESFKKDVERKATIARIASGEIQDPRIDLPLSTLRPLIMEAERVKGLEAENDSLFHGLNKDDIANLIKLATASKDKRIEELGAVAEAAAANWKDNCIYTRQVMVEALKEAGYLND